MSGDDYMTAMRVEKPKSLRPVLLVLAALGTILLTALVMAVEIWSSAWDTSMSVHGYIAMGLGVLVTLALGGGLMALVFYSNRHGYDDAAASEEEDGDRR